MEEKSLHRCNIPKGLWFCSQQKIVVTLLSQFGKFFTCIFYYLHAAYASLCMQIVTKLTEEKNRPTERQTDEVKCLCWVIELSSLQLYHSNPELGESQVLIGWGKYYALTNKTLQKFNCICEQEKNLKLAASPFRGIVQQRDGWRV